MTPNFAKMLTDYLCAYLPLRLKAYHIINNPANAQPFIKLAIQLLNGKYRQRALIHGEDTKEFHRHIAVDCLPECYGGCGKDVELESSELFDIANVKRRPCFLSESEPSASRSGYYITSSKQRVRYTSEFEIESDLDPTMKKCQHKKLLMAHREKH
ncbi:hypothetical protein GQX74_005847 [Glossina fuscipes]|nr:hypothetical protein GQX74_005847 [Glossina fuscipes]